MVTLNRPLHTIQLSCTILKQKSFIHIRPTHLHFFIWGLLISFTRHYYQWWCSNDAVVQYKIIYNTYLGQPKSIHDWVFFWSHYICGYWNVYCSVYHSQPLESCCQSKRKPWEMFSHQQETTYNICESSIQRNLYYMQADTVCIELVALICVKSSDLSCHLCLLCYYDQLVLFNKEIHANIYRHSL